MAAAAGLCYRVSVCNSKICSPATAVYPVTLEEFTVKYPLSNKPKFTFVASEYTNTFDPEGTVTPVPETVLIYMFL